MSQAILSKSVIHSFYGKGPDYSYWSGCSQGGRQGLMLAQRFPDAYDGISAGAPAINWVRFFPAIQGPQQVMNELREYPPVCEMDAIVAAAVDACDGYDGVVDGIIGEALQCLDTFDPFSVVGTAINCTQLNSTVSVSRAAAIVVNATWHGITTAEGKFEWYGILPGADLTGTSPKSYGQSGVAATTCNGTACVGSPHVLGQEWLQLFIVKDPSFDFGNLTRKQFDWLMHLSIMEYSSIIDTSEPDLSVFRDNGGKIITFHGLVSWLLPPSIVADPYIPYNLPHHYGRERRRMTYLSCTTYP